MNLLSKVEMKKINGGYIDPNDDCSGKYFFVITPAYCGYGIGTRLDNGNCWVAEPADKIPQPCAFA